MKPPERVLTWGLILLLLILIATTILLASVPPIDRDALTHHLFVPKLWLKHGGIYEIPEIPFSYYPMNLDLLYTIPLYFGNDIVPKYIHYFFALATGLLLYRHLAARLNRQYGLLGPLFFLSIPIVVKLSITVYVDLGLVFFTTAALLLLLRWAAQNFSPRFLVLAGMCCGLAAGTKYNGLIGVVVLTLFVPMLYQQSVPKERQSNGKALLWGGYFCYRHPDDLFTLADQELPLDRQPHLPPAQLPVSETEPHNDRPASGFASRQLRHIAGEYLPGRQRLCRQENPV
jgi:4-amino-4-deoxy-L-arabinose transferase and related glycosyltransferases of PMT family